MDTVAFQGKMKRGKKAAELFEKINKSIKKKGPTKDWICQYDDDNLIIYFGDIAECDRFVLNIGEGGKIDSFLRGNFFGEDCGETKKSLFTMIDILYSGKSFFSFLKISDDYGICENYWDSKRFKYVMRELTQQEESRIKRLFDDGNVSPGDLLKAIMAEDMHMTVDELSGYTNPGINYSYVDVFPDIFPVIDTYLYETATFYKAGRLCELPDYVYHNPGTISNCEYVFLMGVCKLFGNVQEIGLMPSPQMSQVNMMYKEKFVPEYARLDNDCDRCILAYRYWVSTYEYLGFEFVGRVI